uniref:Replicative DNA helicase n=1 Tax=Liagora brachyclada TaxID=1884665 RepID=A0A1G4P0G6_9FLOR|nr:Replication helicase subunit [Liagora brachyclada]SCW24286.1 Replication helicase subunit [Liagora brachyclada]
MRNQDSLIKYHEQFPPQHNLAEEIVLGGILVNTEIMQLAINELIIESFSLETHQIIYRTIIEIYIQKDYIDSIILINTLWDLNLLSHIGGIRKILNLLKNAQIFVSHEFTYLTAQYYINIIKDKYLRRLLIQYGYNIIRIAYISSITPRILLNKTDQYLDQIKIQCQYRIKDNASSILANLLLNLRSDYQLHENKHLLSGFHELDNMNNGFHEGDLIVIAGRPSMGKTSLSLNIALNILTQQKQSICIFSLEMSREQILHKLLSTLAKIPVSKLQLGHINTTDWEKIQRAANQLVESQIHINDNANLSLNNLVTTAKKLKSDYPKLQLIIIDYLQLIQFSNNSLSSRAEELSTITRSLKVLAKELCLPIIVLSQLNRNVENRVNKRPMLSDLRESGCISGTNILIQQKSEDSKKSKFLYHEHVYIYHTLVDKYNQYKLYPKIIPREHKYTYHLQDVSQSICSLTHNHPLLTKIGWRRADGLKKFHTSQYTGKFTRQYFSSTFKKYNMYDLVLPETQSFSCNSECILHNSIEQDADLVLMLYRESYYYSNSDQDNSTNQVTNLIVAKHRNGPTGSVELYFNPTFCSFHNT